MGLAGEEFDGLFPPVTCQPSTSPAMYAPPISSYPDISQAPTYPPVAPYPQIHQPTYLTPNYGQQPAQPYWQAPQSNGHGSFSVYPPGSLSPPPTLNHTSPLLGAYPDSRSRSPSASSGSSYPPITADDPAYVAGYPPRPVSPGSPDLRAYGYPNADGSWSCAYDGCTSRAVFTRGCDLRKHYKRHTKSFFCRHEGCPQATGGGFSSKKDLARHEAKHNPGVICEFPGCDRVFSRVDNMVSCSTAVTSRSMEADDG
jgi:hypothetical protein